MNKKKLILEIFKKRLNLKPNEIKDIQSNKFKKFELGTHQNWDSIQHVNIINDIEKKLKINVNDKNFVNFGQLEKILIFLKII